MNNIDRVKQGYIECAEWLEEELEANPDDCVEFINSVSANDLDSYLKVYDLEHLGHDIYLTSKGHGAGFWDRGLGELGERLTTYAELIGVEQS